MENASQFWEAFLFSMKRRTPIKEWREDERPREKLILKGAQSLSDAELIAILISSGTKEESALDISRKILSKAGDNLRELGRLNYQNLTQIKGVGPSKAVMIMAVFELFKRFLLSEGKDLPKINSSSYAAKIISPLLRDLSHEECWVL